jgi:tagaturonate reductase
MVKINESSTKTERPVKILQFGEGNFLRAFIDWQVDIANEKTDFNGSVVIAQPLAQGMADFINDQNGIYTTVLRGIENGKMIKEYRKITSVKSCINVYKDFASYIKYAECDTLRFIVSNTTEAGISYEEGCSLTDEPPVSYPAKVTQFLYKRFMAFNGAADKGIIFIPCELIEANGENLKRIVLQYASEWNLSKEFIAWINNSCTFTNTLVDRIVTGYPRKTADELCEELGYKDNLLDTAERFHLFVIESDGDLEALKKELPLEQAGCNVIWTHDQSFYRTRKVRILNGAHTLFVPTAFLYGLTSVSESLENETVYTFLKKGLFEEIIPSLDGDKQALEDYAAAVLERFANPYLEHQLLSISLNSVSKFKVRDLTSVLAYYEKFNKAPKTLAYGLAALITFYNGKDVANREMTGSRNGEAYPIKDDEAVLKAFETLYSKNNYKMASGREAIVTSVLERTDWWGLDLSTLEGFKEAVLSSYNSIAEEGIVKSLKAYTKTK